MLDPESLFFQLEHLTEDFLGTLVVSLVAQRDRELVLGIEDIGGVFLSQLCTQSIEYHSSLGGCIVEAPHTPDANCTGMPRAQCLSSFRAEQLSFLTDHFVVLALSLG